MIISVASGKGGTGKTTVAVAMAMSIKNAQLLDCDVEEPNAHIFVRPIIGASESANIPVPLLEEAKCNYCGKCADVCEYHAIAVVPSSSNSKGSVLIFPNLCHGCGACILFCPKGAMGEGQRKIGVVEIGEREHMQFVHGRLNVGEAMAPPIIKHVKNYVNPTRVTIIDAPPGTSCPVISAVKGSDFCILVTEPTPFGLNDLRLAVDMLRALGIKFGVVVNRFDMGDKKVEEYCKNENIDILMRIPFRKEIARAYSCGKPLIEAFPGMAGEFRGVLCEIENKVRDDKNEGTR